MKALILAGGFGKRLRDINSNKPKPMVDVLGRPFLDYQLYYLRRSGFSQIILSVGYMAGSIIEHYGSGERLGLSIEYVVEHEPLGTGGAIRFARPLLDDTSLILNGDTYYSFDIGLYLHQHRISGAKMSILTYVKELGNDYGNIVTDTQGNIVSFSEKQSGIGPSLVSCGAYFVEPDIIDLFGTETPLSLEVQVLPTLLKKGLKINAINTNGDFYDIGTPERYNVFCEYVIKNGYTIGR